MILNPVCRLQWNETLLTGLMSLCRKPTEWMLSIASRICRPSLSVVDSENVPWLIVRRRSAKFLPCVYSSIRWLFNQPVISSYKQHGRFSIYVTFRIVTVSHVVMVTSLLLIKRDSYTKVILICVFNNDSQKFSEPPRPVFLSAGIRLH